MKKLVLLMFLVIGGGFLSEVSAQRKAVSAAEVTGVFSTGKNGNTMKSQALGSGKLKVEFMLTYMRRMENGEWTANTGEPSGIATIIGDTAVLDLSQDDRVCKITIKFVKLGTVEVSEGDDCGGIVGGMNVTSFGTYKRVSSKKPKFSF